MDDLYFWFSTYKSIFVERIKERLLSELKSKNSWSKAPTSFGTQNHDGIYDYGIFSVYYWTDDRFVRIIVDSYDCIKDIARSGFRIYKPSSEYYCLTCEFEEILMKYSSHIRFLGIPDGYPRLNASLFDYFKQTIENLIGEIFKAVEKYPAYDAMIVRYDYFIGVHYNCNLNELYEITKRYGVFSYLPIYKQINWNFEMVEKYKDDVIWINLLQDTNLVFDESALYKYDKYIPYNHLKNGYSKFVNITNVFIESHKDIIDWASFVRYSNFSWNASEMLYYYNYANKTGKSWSIQLLMENNNFEFTIYTLRTIIELDPETTLKNCIGNDRIANVLRQIPNHKKMVGMYIDDPYYYYKLTDGKEMRHNEYSELFTISNIKKNRHEWESIIEEKYLRTHRTSDSNYHIYGLFNMWDYFSKNTSIFLTYSLCAYLRTIKVTIGGTYVLLDNSNYIEDDDRYEKVNGLALFCWHKIKNKQDIIKICSNPKLLKTILDSKKGRNYDIIDHLIDSYCCEYDVNLKELLDNLEQN